MMQCRVCDSRELELALDLGLQPWANHFLTADQVGTEPRYPLRLLFCADCATVQLDYTVPKEVMFGDHTYLSGITRSLDEHFRQIAEEVHQRFVGNAAGKHVLDIGSNDGTQLKHFQKLGYEVQGVESSRRTAEIAVAGGVPTVNDYFNLALARGLDRRFHIINAAGVFFHLEELHSVAEGIREVLHPDGVFVVQALYMRRIVENVAFDQIYHEHLLYYTLRTLQVLLTRHGLELFDARIDPIHGGSIIGYAAPAGRRPASDQLARLFAEEDAAQSNELATYVAFGRDIARLKERDLAYLEGVKARGARAFGFGAPVKGNTLLNTFGIDSRLLECLVEKNALRRGLYAPGSHIPIAIEEDLPDPPDVYYVLAWNFRREILARNEALVARGVEFYFPIMPKDG